MKENKMIEVKGKNGISAKVIADSIGPTGKRHYTLEMVYPRIILAEVNTHRALSKNTASSRAIPIGKAIEQVQENPMFPVYWGSAQSGMQAGPELIGVPLEIAKALWQKGIDQNIALVKEFDELKVHKQIAARWLETGQLIKTVISGTDWDNLQWLRNDDAAQPEFHELAKCIQECFDKSVPEVLKPGEWHTPYVAHSRDANGKLLYLDADGNELTLDEARKISASCCAQVSYRRLNDSKEKAIEIFDKLFSGSKPHMSPVEHVCTPMQIKQDTIWEDGVTHVTRGGDMYSGNLNSWIQYRQLLPNNNFIKEL